MAGAQARDMHILNRQAAQNQERIRQLQAQLAAINAVGQGPAVNAPQPPQQFELVGRQRLGIPYFYGRENECFRTWLERFELIAESEQWDDAHKLRLLPTFLYDRAFDAYKELLANQRDTYPHLTEHLAARLIPQNTTQRNIALLFDRKQKIGESIREYANFLTRQLRSAFPNANDFGAYDQFLLNFFLRGIDTRLKRDVVATNPQNFNAAVETAANIDEADSENLTPLEPLKNRYTVNATLDKIPSQQGADLRELQDANKGLQEMIKVLLQEKLQDRTRENASQNHTDPALLQLIASMQQLMANQQASQRSHTSNAPRNQNRFANRPQYTPGGRSVCFYCGLPGHFQRDCQQNPASPSFQINETPRNLAPQEPVYNQPRYNPISNSMNRNQNCNRNALGNHNAGFGTYDNDDDNLYTGNNQNNTFQNLGRSHWDNRIYGIDPVVEGQGIAAESQSSSDDVGNQLSKLTEMYFPQASVTKNNQSHLAGTILIRDMRKQSQQKQFYTNIVGKQEPEFVKPSETRMKSQVPKQADVRTLHQQAPTPAIELNPGLDVSNSNLLDDQLTLTPVVLPSNETSTAVSLMENKENTSIRDRPSPPCVVTHKSKPPEHIIDHNPNTFEAEDLKKLKMTAGLKSLDKTKEAECKEYKMKKEAEQGHKIAEAKMDEERLLLQKEYQNKLDKVHNESDPNNPRERTEGIRLHVIEQMDHNNGDRMTLLNEFLKDTQTDDYKKYTQEEDTRRYQEEMARRQMPEGEYPDYYYPQEYVGQPQLSHQPWQQQIHPKTGQGQVQPGQDPQDLQPTHPAQVPMHIVQDSPGSLPQDCILPAMQEHRNFFWRKEKWKDWKWLYFLVLYCLDHIQQQQFRIRGRIQNRKEKARDTKDRLEQDKEKMLRKQEICEQNIKLDNDILRKTRSAFPQGIQLTGFMFTEVKQQRTNSLYED